MTVAGGGTLDLNGFSQSVPSLTNAGLVNMGTGTAPGTVLTTTSYTGTGGTMAINTVLGGDNSPSDKLVISGGAASGSTIVHVTNVGGVGAETVNGIQVVSAVGGAATAPGAFALPAGELRAGAFDYDLLRGGVSGASPNDWFLRSGFARARSLDSADRSLDAARAARADRCPADIHPAAEPSAARHRVSDHRARARHLWGGAASGATIGPFDPRHTRRPGRRYLRAGWLRCCACGLFRRGRDFCGPPADQEAGGGADQKALNCALSVIHRPQSGDASSAKRSTTTIKPSPIPTPAAIWESFQGQDRSSARISDRRHRYERAQPLCQTYGGIARRREDGLVTNSAATATLILTHTGSMNLAPGRRAAAGRSQAQQLVSRRRAARDLVLRRLGQHPRREA